MTRSIPPHLRRLISASAGVRNPGGFAVESARPDTITSAAADDILHRIATLMRQTSSDETGDLNEYRRALGLFLARADKGLRAMLPGSRQSEPDAEMALEAVIRADGTRPSFLVRQNACDPHHPLAGDWRPLLTANPEVLSLRVAAVGRIQPAGGSATNFFGTGWLVDRGQGLVLTNLHVLLQMWGRLANRMTPDGSGGYSFLGDAAFIDFAAESGSLERKQFRIVSGSPSGTDGTGFNRLDFAVLRIEPVSGADASPELPEAIPVIADSDSPNGNTTSFCVVGYPGPPPYTTGIHDKVDWTWVNRTLFGNRFGVKRLAPGAASTPLGGMADDPNGWVFGHDATTLGGSSGSPVLDWINDGTGGVGLHFAGATNVTNCAHAIIQIRKELTKLGVTVRDPG
jgi:hypothetical protein